MVNEQYPDHDGHVSVTCASFDDCLYDKIGDISRGKVKMVTVKGVLCTLKQEKGAGGYHGDHYQLDGTSEDEECRGDGQQRRCVLF